MSGKGTLRSSDTVRGVTDGMVYGAIAAITRGMPQIQKAIALMEAEYREMPGLVLTLGEAERLLGFDQATCERAVEVLMGRRFLKRLPTGAYLRNRPG